MSTVYGLQSTIYITFDNNHLPHTIISNSTTVATYQFNGVNAPITKKLGNTVSLNIEYNNRYAITKHDWKLNGNTIAGYNYGHDSVGNRIWSENLVNANKSELFAFDNADRLTSFKTGTLNGSKTAIITPTYTQDWNLDSIGNWAGFNDNGTNSTNFFSDTHAMTEFKGVIQTFDNNGNLIFDGVRTFKYDAFNRIIEVKVGAIILAQYQYDAFNRRVMKKVDADLNGSFETTLKFLYDGFRCIEELNGSDALLTEYVYGSLYIDEVILQKSGSVDYYFTHDYRYSVTSLTNTAGSIVESYDYKVYGERISSGSGLTTIGYTGQRHDVETGLMYFKNRYYSTSMGSFVTRDPLGYVDGLSMYLGYFGGMGLDPDGKNDYPPSNPKTGNPQSGSGSKVNPGNYADTENKDNFPWAKVQLVTGGKNGLLLLDVTKEASHEAKLQRQLQVVKSKKEGCDFELNGTMSIGIRIKLLDDNYHGNQNYLKHDGLSYLIGSNADQGFWRFIIEHETVHFNQIITAFKKAISRMDAVNEKLKNLTQSAAEKLFKDEKEKMFAEWEKAIKDTCAHVGFNKRLDAPIDVKDAFEIFKTGTSKTRGKFESLYWNPTDKSQHLVWEHHKKEYNLTKEQIEQTEQDAKVKRNDPTVEGLNYDSVKQRNQVDKYSPIVIKY